MTIVSTFGKIFSPRASRPDSAPRNDARIALRLTSDAPFRVSAY